MKRLHVEHANLTILGDVNPNLGIPQNPLDMVKSCEVWELVPSDIWMLVKYGEILCRPMEVRAFFLCHIFQTHLFVAKASSRRVSRNEECQLQKLEQ